MKLLFLLLTVISFGAVGQSLSPEVIGTSGDHFTNTSTQLSWTVGEIAIETYTQSSNQLTQGFHQYIDPTANLTSFNDILVCSAYPNPFSNNLTVVIEDLAKANEIVITNSLGQQVRKVMLVGQTSVNLDTADLAPGIYYVLVKTEGNNAQNIKVQKY